jgi:ABC-type molybdate transport system permease subunit
MVTWSERLTTWSVFAVGLLLLFANPLGLKLFGVTLMIASDLAATATSLESRIVGLIDQRLDQIEKRTIVSPTDEPS